MKIAVVGAGIFGVSAAVELSKIGHDVTLFERKSDILRCASGINQYRLHRGYHYPRSDETTESIQAALSQFRAEYSEAIVGDGSHYYCIAREGSLISKAEYLDFCKRHALIYEVVSLNLVNPAHIDLCVRVQEELFSPKIIREICLEKIKIHGIDLKLNFEFRNETFADFEKIVIATYSEINSLLDSFPSHRIRLQFELCEKPVVSLPNQFKSKSIVIMDGPFMCIDPIAGSNDFVFGNVVHAIHHSNIGFSPEPVPELMPYLNSGVVVNPPITNFEKFVNSANYFFPDIGSPKHIGSMFTYRAVLAGVEDTDARPTLVRKVSDRVLIVFSGKIANCVLAGTEVAKQLC